MDITLQSTPKAISSGPASLQSVAHLRVGTSRSIRARNSQKRFTGELVLGQRHQQVIAKI